TWTASKAGRSSTMEHQSPARAVKARPPAQPLLLNQTEAAARLGRSVRTMMGWVAAGQLTAVWVPKAGGKGVVAMFRPQDLEAFVERCRVPSLAEGREEKRQKQRRA